MVLVVLIEEGRRDKLFHEKRDVVWCRHEQCFDAVVDLATVEW